MNENKENLNILNFEEILWGIVIFSSIINIYGDEKQKSYLKVHNIQDAKKAKKAFLLALVISFFSSLYFVSKNYNNYIKQKKSKNSSLNLTKLFGSILSLIGISLIIYYELTEKDYQGTSTM